MIDALGQPRSLAPARRNLRHRGCSRPPVRRPGCGERARRGAGHRLGATPSSRSSTSLGCTTVAHDFEAREPHSHAALVAAVAEDGDIDVAVLAFGVARRPRGGLAGRGRLLGPRADQLRGGGELRRRAGPAGEPARSRRAGGVVERGRRTAPAFQLRLRVDQGRDGQLLHRARRGTARRGRAGARRPARVRPLEDDRGAHACAAVRDAGRGRRAPWSKPSRRVPSRSGSRRPCGS